MAARGKVIALHLAVLAVLFGLHFVLPAYHHTNFARIMVLAVFAMGYNIAFGYTGLLSLGHALFFGFGMYGAGLAVYLVEWPAAPALWTGLVAGGVAAGAVGLLALRTAGVSFMIVTLMFAQAGYLTVLYFGAWTGGDEGFVVERLGRNMFGYDLSMENPRYIAAFLLFSAGLLIKLALVQSPLGRVMVAMRENEARSRMLGYNPFAVKWFALVVSGLYAGAAGAAYAVLFGYAGASFTTIQYSILPMLWVLMGGAGVVLGPLVGVVVMFYLIDIASTYTSAHLMVVGVALLVLVLFAPKGLLGFVRARWLSWLP
ncbi:MAG: branched-chain amino acid ABC transporter permease [Paracoccaceae bacterium]